MATSDIPAVDIADVRKHYGLLEALKGVDLRIEQGEFFGLLGPNGAGKSTLIGIMAGLARASSGRVRIMGHDTVSDFRRARAALGVVPQELVYDPFFSVRELLELQSGYFGLLRNGPWIDELLHVLDLSDKADANMQALSGGMKRRVLIAQALVHRPPVVVLDEPTAGVDVELRQALWRLTRKLHGEGHTIVLTTHYLEEAEALCDRIAILDHGAVCALDTKDGLLNRYPWRLLRLTLTDEHAVLPEAVSERIVDRSGCGVTLRLRKDTDNAGEVLAALFRAGVSVTDIHTEEPSLEDVFMELTGDEEAA
jgi:ABC-2 type transport system ATP-binding protein